MAGPRRQDYEDEYGNVDFETFYEDQLTYGDMKYDEWKDEQMEKAEEERKLKKEKNDRDREKSKTDK